MTIEKQLTPQEYSHSRLEAIKEKNNKGVILNNDEKDALKFMGENVSNITTVTEVNISKLQCIKCKESKNCSKDRVVKLLQKHSSLERLQNEYLCKKCRK